VFKTIRILTLVRERLLGAYRFLLLLSLVHVAAISLPASAASITPPKVSVALTDGSQNPIMIVDTTSVGAQPFTIAAGVEWAVPFSNTAWAAGGDTYFGVILPGGTSVATWSPNSNGVMMLNGGYAPIARAISVVNLAPFSTTTVNGGVPLTYKFSGAEPKGLYLLFMFMVPTGVDPTDIERWTFFTTQPFFVK
jgi:hypothetical protein